MPHHHTSVAPQYRIRCTVLPFAPFLRRQSPEEIEQCGYIWTEAPADAQRFASLEETQRQCRLLARELEFGISWFTIEAL